MKTSEIKELLDNIHSHIDGNWDIDNGMASDCATAIETLLAREAGVLSQCPKDSTCCAGCCRLSRIRAILVPENDNGN